MTKKISVKSYRKNTGSRVRKNEEDEGLQNFAGNSLSALQSLLFSSLEIISKIKWND